MKLLQNYESYFLFAKAQEVVQSSTKYNSKWKPKYFGPSTSISLTLRLSLSLPVPLSMSLCETKRQRERDLLRTDN